MNDTPNLPKHFGEIRMLSKKRGMKKPVKKTCKNCGDMACQCRGCKGGKCPVLTGKSIQCSGNACEYWRQKK